MRRKRRWSLIAVSVALRCLLIETAGTDAVTKEEFTRRECAICHITWLDAFRIREEPGVEESWAPTLIEKTLDVVANDEMCYSCHDGFVMDSRLRVWEGTGHSVGKKPSDKVVIPDGMPMNREGTVYCGTCHTPHGVGEKNADLTGSFFLRIENVDSNLCTQCHVSEQRDLRRRNHSVNVLGKAPLTQEIYWLGGRLGSDARKIICQSCHTPHGKSTLLKPVEDSSLCLMCHGEKDNQGLFLRTGRPLHPVGIIPKGDLSGARVSRYGAKWGREGRIICLTCHGIHSGLDESLTLDPQMSSFCQGCHPDQGERVAAGKHSLEKTAPDLKNSEGETPGDSGPCRTCHKAHGWAHAGATEQDTPSTLCLVCHREGGTVEKLSVGRISHPVDVEVKGLGKEAALVPLEANGKKLLVCSTCHDPHGDLPAIEAPLPKQGEAGGGKMLRVEKMTLCRECHLDQFTLDGTKHDLKEPAERMKLEAHFGTAPTEQECFPCHRVHNAEGPGLWFVSLPEPRSAFNQEESSRKCLTCHGQEAFGKIREERGHPVGRPMKTEYLPLPDDRLKLGRVALDSGGVQDVVTCATCHLSHGAKNQDGSITLFAGGGFPDGELCVACHRENAKIRSSPHDFRFRKEDEFRPDEGRSLEFGECAGCHTNHNAVIEQGLIAFTVDPPKGRGNREDMFCLHCHLDPRINHDREARFYMHPSAEEVKESLEQSGEMEERPETDRLGEAKRTTTEGYEALFRIRCTTCHDNHRWTSIPQEEAGFEINTEMTSFLRGSEVAETLCANCHGAEALYRYRYYHQERAFRLKIPNR
jgi:predicted CXXCH cytochrome family protein